MALSKRLRYEVMRRDGHRCRYCGNGPEDDRLTVDHVVPVALGGDDKPENLVTACAGCNAGKTSSSPDAPLVESVADDALRWAEAMKQAAEVEKAGKKRMAPYIKAVDKLWLNWHTIDSQDNPVLDDEGNPEPLPRPADWKTTVENFVVQGLTKEELLDGVRITMDAKNVYIRNLWRYFCGVCWKKIRNRQDIARALLEAEGEK